MTINILIPGAPIAKKRPRFFRRGSFVGTYNCQDTEEGKWKWEMLRQIGEMKPIPSGTPLRLSCIFFMPIPSSMSRKKVEAVNYRHVKKPDTDNLLKFVKDCGNGVLWADDSQVCEVSARKQYDPEPRTSIEVEAL